MDEKFNSGPSGFPDWGSGPSSLNSNKEHVSTFEPGESIAPPVTTIPVSIDVPEPPKPEPAFKPADNILPEVPSPPTTSFKDETLPPLPPQPTDFDQGKAGDAEHPLAVTQVYSSYGLEYLIMLISLAVLSFSLAALLNAIVDLSTAKTGLVSSILDPYSEAALVVSLPIFAYLFIRLEAREESHASFLTDSSRRRGIQISLVVSFIFFIGQLIGYLGKLFSSGSDFSSLNPWSYSYDAVANSSPWWTDLLHALIGLMIAGGVFAYFWYKLHKKTGSGL